MGIWPLLHFALLPYFSFSQMDFPIRSVRFRKCSPLVHVKVTLSSEDLCYFNNVCVWWRHYCWLVTGLQLTDQLFQKLLLTPLSVVFADCQKDIEVNGTKKVKVRFQCLIYYFSLFCLTYLMSKFLKQVKMSNCIGLGLVSQRNIYWSQLSFLLQL